MKRFETTFLQINEWRNKLGEEFLDQCEGDWDEPSETLSQVVTGMKETVLSFQWKQPRPCQTMADVIDLVECSR